MKKISLLSISALSGVLVLSVACTSPDPQKLSAATEENKDVSVEQAAPALSGEVVETMDTGGYTYVHLEKGGEQVWVAVPQMEVSVGQNVSFQPGMVMNNFTSKTLDRTFEAVVFSSGPIDQQGMNTAAGHAAKSGAAMQPADTISVEKASGADAYTVAELYEKSADLDTKNIVVRGQVVKFSENIMGKNWIHLQDGTGSPSDGTNDILVTSQDVPAVGDIVTVEGIVAKSRDFGSGYKYDVIVEQASIKK